MSLPHKICNLAVLAGFFATVCVPAFAREHAPAGEQQPARLKIIDAALAQAEVEFFEHPPAPEVHSSSGGNTFGLTEAQSRENIIDAALKKHSLEAGVELFYYRYEEPDLMKTAGIMQGIYTNYTYRPSFDDLLYTGLMNLYKIEARYSRGDVDYTSEGSGSDDNIPDWSVELRGILGKEYTDGPFRTVLYTGGAYRYLNDNSSGRLTDLGYYGYQRESNYYYLPAGFEFSNQINDTWSVGITGEYDWLVYGLQISHLSDGDQFTGMRSEDAENEQDHGYGLRASIQLVRQSDIADLVFGPFVRFWNIEDSEISTTLLEGSITQGLEPENNTIEAGLKVGLRF
ncbi:MAG TPA: hypothetical protein VJC08_02185 [bacterium]|nr:hypothetical protein [bacterium]